jgi:predicted NUDIX family NTP pyrophosphohydrolase
MGRIKLYEEFRKINKKDFMVHSLSGIAVVVEDRILLVHPTKFKKEIDKWSIPKGHVEGNDSLKSALMELKEESGIDLDDKYDDVIKITYKKSGSFKFMDVYIYHISKEDVSKYLKNDWEIEEKFYNKEEVFRCKFFKFSSARNKIELNMIDIIDHIENFKG